MHMSLPERLYDQCYNIRLSAGQHCWYKFTPSDSGEYRFYSSGSADTFGQLYQESTLLASNDNSGDGNNFLFSQSLTAGTEYRLRVKGATLSSSGSFSLHVSRRFDVSVKHYVDEGYIDRFGSGTNISSYQNVCNSILDELFNLHITSTVQNYHSVCDDC